MSSLIRICAVAELPGEGEACEMMAIGRPFCVARVDGEIAVLDGVCPHNEGPLGQGIVENGRVVCPWHAWAFDAKTGVAEHSARARVQVYEASVENGELLVRLP
jgi:nitrite reductase (NADH) small subunit